MCTQTRHAAAVALIMLSARVFAQTTEQKPPMPAPATDTSAGLRIFIGLSALQMNEFNPVLRAQQNQPIERAFEVAGEVDAVPVPVPSLKTVTVKIPAGLVCVNASSRTTHTANGASATVNWSLPFCGAYVSPRLSFRRGGMIINLRPIGIGYYRLGQSPMRAELTISDRAGSLRAEATTWGYLGMAGVEYPLNKTSMLVEAGYRSLRFDDVRLTAQNGFTTGVGGVPVQVSSLGQPLDFGGFMFRVGMGIRF